MAGMGPPPKDPRLRQRVNKVTTAAKLPADGDAPPREIPPLPKRKCPPCEGTGAVKGEACATCEGSGIWAWHELTLAMWADVWRSPMAGEFVQADVHRLYAYAVLVDRFWLGEVEQAAEIRLQGQCFGLTPLDRRRLQWEVEKVEQAQKRRPPVAPPSSAEAAKRKRDPLSYLRAVQGGKA